MQKEIYIHVTKEETKAAVLENRQLVEVYLDRSFQRRLAGNIYKGRVANVLPGMQAAFVNIGLERNAFCMWKMPGPIIAGHFPFKTRSMREKRSWSRLSRNPLGLRVGDDTFNISGALCCFYARVQIGRGFPEIRSRRSATA